MCRFKIPTGHPQIFLKMFTEKHLCWNLFFNKVAGVRPAKLFQRDSNTGVFLCILRNF